MAPKDKSCTFLSVPGPTANLYVRADCEEKGRGWIVGEEFVKVGLGGKEGMRAVVVM